MRFHVLSDLHQEFGEIDVPAVPCDAVILAGDVSVKKHGLEWIQQRYQDTPVIYLCGNHEYYGEKFPSLRREIRQMAKGSHIHFLENDSIVLGGVPIFGCTLWTDMALQGAWQQGAEECNATMNDYKRIRNSDRGYQWLAARDTRAAHEASLEMMEEFFREHDPAESIIVTHHAPSKQSLPASRQDELISSAYASNLEEFILKHQPKLWIHGHIHHHSDYQIGRTRVLANPRGYPDEPDTGFEPGLVIEI